jgi:hypothetical protein
MSQVVAMEKIHWDVEECALRLVTNNGGLA